VFWLAFGAAVLALIATILAPAGQISQLAKQRSQAETEHVPPPLPIGD
jgi:heme exporter protein D